MQTSVNGKVSAAFGGRENSHVLCPPTAFAAADNVSESAKPLPAARTSREPRKQVPSRKDTSTFFQNYVPNAAAEFEASVSGFPWVGDGDANREFSRIELPRPISISRPGERSCNALYAQRGPILDHLTKMN